VYVYEPVPPVAAPFTVKELPSVIEVEARLELFVILALFTLTVNVFEAVLPLLSVTTTLIL